MVTSLQPCSACGVQAIKAVQEELSLDDVERIMDDAAEGQQYVEEMNDILSEQLSDYDSEQAAKDLSLLQAVLCCCCMNCTLPISCRSGL